MLNIFQFQNIDLQHRTTRKSIPGLVDKSLKMRKMEKRIDDLEASNAKIKKDIHDIHKLVKGIHILNYVTTIYHKVAVKTAVIHHDTLT